MEEVLKQIKAAVLEAAERHGVEVEKVILFGSRARGDCREESDWDVLVVTKNRLSHGKKIDFWYKIYKKIDAPADILIVSKQTFEKYRDSKGFIYSYAIAEGRVV